MAKKKNRHKVAHGGAKKAAPKNMVQATANQPVSAADQTNESSPVVAVRAEKTQALSASGEARWRYVGQDLRRIGVLFVCCVALELALAYALDYTSLGTNIFNSIKI